MPFSRTFSRASVTLAALLVALFSAAAMLPESRNYFAAFTVSSDDGVTARYLFDPPRQLAACKASLVETMGVVRDICPQCAMDAGQCLPAVDGIFAAALTEAPLPLPSAHIPGGVVLFDGNQELAARACALAEQDAVLREGRSTVVCFPAGSFRPQALHPAHRVGFADALQALASALAAFTVALVGCGLLIRYEHLHARFSHDQVSGGPQKLHAVPTPRIGGVAILLGLITGAAGAAVGGQPSLEIEYGWFLVAAMPAFAGGIAEDLIKQIGVVMRLLLTMLSGALGAWLLGGTLARMDAPGIDLLLAWAPFAVIVTLVAVGGLANAINIIDGFNGLAGGYCIIAAIAFAWLSATLGDTLLLMASLSLAAGIGGFLAWNYPKGRIFLGDGGAYLVGFWLAEIGVLLTVRNPEVSAWFVLAVLAYPVTETLFSIYRRRLLRRQSPGLPDRMHFHQVFFHRAVGRALVGRNADARTARNAGVAPRIWAANLPFVVAACYFWQSPVILVGLCALFLGAYVWAYRRLVRMKTPKWMSSAGKPPRAPTP